VADALDAAHRAGVIHRDVKPANVLVPPSGPVKVTDFGIAKAAGGDDLTRTGTVMGTARYLAPEQVNGRPTDARTDVYALGLLLYESLCGHPPFGGDTDIATAMARLTTTAPAIRAERPEVSGALDDVIHRCLARQPAARFATAAAVRDALDAARFDPTGAVPRPAPAARPPVAPAPAAQTAPVPRPASPSQPVARRRGGWLWMVFVLLVAIAGGVAAFFLVRDDSTTSSKSSGAPAPPVSQVTNLTASAFDPLGDGREDNDHLPLAVDGNSSTSWSTERYDRNFPDGRKTGVGLALDLGGEYDVHRVIVDTKQQGWSATIYVSNRPATELTALADWGPERAKGSDLGLTHSFPINKVRGRSVLLWLTKLPTRDDGKHYLDVNEVRVA
jgi:serine/threonine protein kinase